MKTKLFVRLTLPLFLALGSARAYATGYYGPMVYLDQGGRNVAASPEFYWELEVKRLARDFHPPEKLVLSQLDTAAVDERDFASAMLEGRMKPADPAEATRQQAAARAVIDRTNATSTETLPAEFPSEFADYHRGAFAYARGLEHWPEARQAWEALLKRPAPERHYRSVWAAFMLGKIALKQNDPTAGGWFQRTRELARDGFVDSLGMAADSYGWEGRSEWKQDHAEKAAPLFLTQLALGDESAIVSLKALIPDRVPTEGMLNYDPEPQEAVRSHLERAARDPLLRRLITAHILATSSVPGEFLFDSKEPIMERGPRWLAMIQKLRLTELADAEYLGWTAYNGGDYDSAARWLTLAQADAPAAAWLRAKLQLRAGKVAAAATSMAAAWHTLRDTATYTGWKETDEESDRFVEFPQWTLAQSASGDLGALHLERGDFVQALDTLLAGDLWNDAAFVAERVLTTSELKADVDEHASEAKDNELRKRLRYLLGRRLVRDDKYEQARAYLPPPYDEILGRYVAALHQGRDKTQPKSERARALFIAAWLARYDGMELMGTEGAPDGFAERGNFEVPDLAAQLRSGFYRTTSYVGGEEVAATKPVVLHLPARERRRLTKTKPAPDLRFHYRVIAGALAVEAANLLPNDSEELADVINCAGLWVKDRDEKLGNRYFQMMERRAANTTIGRAARHWFVDQSGPWSDEQRQARDAMRKELHFPPEE